MNELTQLIAQEQAQYEGTDDFGDVTGLGHDQAMEEEFPQRWLEENQSRYDERAAA